MSDIEARQLISNQLLQTIITRQLDGYAETLCRGDPANQAATLRAQYAWQAVNELRIAIDEQARKSAGVEPRKTTHEHGGSSPNRSTPRAWFGPDGPG